MPTLAQSSVWEGFDAAIAGDADKGRQLLHCIALQIREGALEPAFGELIAEMLELIVAGEDPDVALLVKRKTKTKNSPDDTFRIWLAVRERLDGREKPKAAYTAVANEENKARPRVTKLSEVPKPITWSGIRQIYLAQNKLFENRVANEPVHFSVEELADIHRQRRVSEQHLQNAAAVRTRRAATNPVPTGSKARSGK